MYPVKIFNGQGEHIKTIDAKELIRLNDVSIGRIKITGPVAGKKELDRKCPQCKKKFKTVDPRVKFCGTNCSKKREKKRAKVAPSRLERKKISAIELAKDKKCKHCGDSYKSANRNKLFCQTECNQRFHENKSKAKDGAIPKRDCVVCGKEFQPKSNRGKYCGDPCDYYTNKQFDS